MSTHQDYLLYPETGANVIRRTAPVSPTKPVTRPRTEGQRTDLQPVRGRVAAAALPEIWGTYNNNRSTALKASATIHGVILALLLSGGLFGHTIVQKVVPHEKITLIAPSPDTYTMQVAKKVVSGGGGGGDHDKLPAPKGALPKVALQQIAPPSIIVRNERPKLAVQPTVVVPPQVHIAENHMPTLGVASAPIMPSAPASNGTGSGGGIGSGSGGGVGVGHGPGVGPGTGGGIGGGIYKVGGGILAPQALATPDPEYTQEARDAKAEGTCILQLIVDQQGTPRDIRVVRGLGHGLDARAVAAVSQWKFQPATKDGQPVNVQIRVEVGFHLY